MKFSKYLRCFLKDLFIAYGCLMMLAAVFLAIYSTETISASLLWQILLLASSYTFFKYALVNKYELGKTAEMISFSICFVLADVMIVLFLWFFSPSQIADKSLLIAYIIVIIAVKGLVYAMLYIDGHAQAKQLNEKLREYKNGGNE